MRRFYSDKKGVSNVLGYVFSFGIASVIMVSAVIVTTGIINNRVSAVAKLEAQSIANKVADAILEAATTWGSMPNADYQKMLDMPEDIAGRNYYVEITDSLVYVNTTDGQVSTSCSNYGAEQLGIGITGGRTYGGGNRLKILIDKSDIVAKFDFGTGDLLSHSPVESGYYMVSEKTPSGSTDRDPPWWDAKYKCRIPILIENDSPEDLIDTPVKIVLNPTNFDYSRANVTINSDKDNITADLTFYEAPKDCIATIDISPYEWDPNWFYQKQTKTIDVTILAISEGYNKNDVDGETIKLSTEDGEIYAASWSNTSGIAKFDREGALGCLDGDGDHFLNSLSYEVSVSGLLKNGRDFAGSATIIIVNSSYVHEGESIRDAIDDVTDGHTIFVYNGVYSESMPSVSINNQINLVGQSRNSTILWLMNALSVYANNVILDSFTVNSYSTTVKDDGIYISSQHVNVINCLISACKKGIHIVNSEDINISNCESRYNIGDYLTGKNGEGIFIEGSSYSVYIRDCNIHDNGIGGTDGDGIVIHGATLSNIYVINCYIHDNQDDGVEIAEEADTNWVNNTNCSNNGDAGVNIAGENSNNNHIINCSFWGNGKGIKIYEGKYNEIRNCEMACNGGFGVLLGETPGGIGTSSNTITNCVVHNNGNDGIHLELAFENTITNCEIYSNGNAVSKSGIYFYRSGKSGEANNINYCNIYNNYDDGIILRSSSYNVINNCNVFDNGDDGLNLSGYQVIDSCNNQILKCNFYGNSRITATGVGVYIAGGSVSNTINYCNFEAQKNNDPEWLPEHWNAYDYCGKDANNWNYNYWDDYGPDHGWLGYYPDYEIPPYLPRLGGGGLNVFDYYPIGPPTPRYSFTPWVVIVNNDYPIPPGPDPNPDYYHVRKIQTGIDRSIAGGIIHIYCKYLMEQPQPYSENVFVNYTLTLIGKIPNDITIKSKTTGSGDVIQVNANYVNITGFNIKNGKNGINTSGHTHLKIENCNIYGNTRGVYMSSSANYNRILNCNIYSNSDKGIYLLSSDYFNITDCEIYNNTIYGIHLANSRSNPESGIFKCNVYENGNHGIYIQSAFPNYVKLCEIYGNKGDGIYIATSGNYQNISNNEIYENKHGIEVYNTARTNITYCSIYSNIQHGIYIRSPSNNNIIRYCDIKDNDQCGINLANSNNNKIEECDIHSNKWGMNLSGGSDSNTIKNSSICDNTNHGINITGSSASNKIFRNKFTNNDENANDSSTGTNLWYDTYPKWLGGTGQGGNYWNNYDEESEGASDYFKGAATPQATPGSDSIADNAYNAFLSNPSNHVKDNYPWCIRSSIKPYYIDYWNPYGESVILVNMSLGKYDETYLYLYYNYTGHLSQTDERFNHGMDEISLFFDDFNDGIFNSQKWIGTITESGGMANLLSPATITTKDYSIPEVGNPIEKDYSKTMNESMYIVEAKVNISSNGQCNIVLLNELGGPAEFFKNYIISVNATPINDFTIYKSRYIGAPVLNLLEKDESMPDISHWLRFKSYLYLSKTCYKPDPSTKTTENLTSITSYIYNDATFTDEGNVSGWDTDIDYLVNDPVGDPYPKGHVCLAAGLLGSPNHQIKVDWIRVTKTPIVSPTTTVGAMESINYGWKYTSTVDSANKVGTNPFDPGPLLCDYNYAKSKGPSNTGTFVIKNLQPNDYTITVTMGNYSGPCAQTIVRYGPGAIYGTTLPATGKGQFQTKWFPITWKYDNRDLELTFSSSSSSTWTVDSLIIEKGKKGVNIGLE